MFKLYSHIKIGKKLQLVVGKLKRHFLNNETSINYFSSYLLLWSIIGIKTNFLRFQSKTIQGWSNIMLMNCCNHINWSNSMFEEDGIEKAFQEVPVHMRCCSGLCYHLGRCSLPAEYQQHEWQFEVPGKGRRQWVAQQGVYEAGGQQRHWRGIPGACVQ